MTEVLKEQEIPKDLTDEQLEERLTDDPTCVTALYEAGYRQAPWILMSFYPNDNLDVFDLLYLDPKHITPAMIRNLSMAYGEGQMHDVSEIEEYIKDPSLENIKILIEAYYYTSKYFNNPNNPLRADILRFILNELDDEDAVNSIFEWGVLSTAEDLAIVLESQEQARNFINIAELESHEWSFKLAIIKKYPNLIVEFDLDTFEEFLGKVEPENQEELDQMTEDRAIRISELVDSLFVDGVAQISLEDLLFQDEVFDTLFKIKQRSLEVLDSN
jgi:hypothetical protein